MTSGGGVGGGLAICRTFRKRKFKNKIELLRIDYYILELNFTTIGGAGGGGVSCLYNKKKPRLKFSKIKGRC